MGNMTQGGDKERNNNNDGMQRGETDREDGKEGIVEKKKSWHSIG